MCRDSIPTCVSHAGRILTTAVPRGPANLASYESARGTSSVIVSPTTAVIVRSVPRTRPGASQVCFWPSRTRSSIPMNLTHSAVAVFRTLIVSPAAKPSASTTVKLVAPEATYASATRVLAPSEGAGPPSLPATVMPL